MTINSATVFKFINTIRQKNVLSNMVLQLNKYVAHVGKLLLIDSLAFSLTQLASKLCSLNPHAQSSCTNMEPLWPLSRLLMGRLVQSRSRMVLHLRNLSHARSYSPQ